MASSHPVFSSYPPHLSQEEQKYLITNLRDWSIAHGLAVRPAPSFVAKEVDPEGVLAVTAPVTLFPSLFPRTCFDKALEVQHLYNKLYAAIARDEKWLLPIIEEIKEIDDFVGELWKVYQAVAQEPDVQTLTLGLFRSDYMVHTEIEGDKSTLGIRQVEFNTIASSFGGLSSKVSQLHTHLQTIGAYPAATSSIIAEDSLRISNAASRLASGLALAHKAYRRPQSQERSCILFVVQDPERNVFDQRHIEYHLLNDHNIRVFRLPFHRILQDTKLTDDRALLYIPPHSLFTPYEVSTIYFRAGYSPDDYASPEDWTARVHLERSRAIKCPSILTHLAGCKKVQQVLATPHSPHLARFLPDPSEAAQVAATFAPIYPLDGSTAGHEAKQLATNAETAQRYVLKPQREGGGNNVYRRAIPEFLANTPSDKWPAYILMEMIEPPAQRNTIFRNGEMQSGGVICELGVYGVVLWDHETGIVEDGNLEAGYLLRTKGDQSEEGGVAAGFGAVDSVCLVD